jgi:hypothetical protein
VAAILLAEFGVRPVSFVEAAVLLRLLYEREYGTHGRAEDRKKEMEAEATAEDIARRHRRGLRSIPIDPDYVPPNVSEN